MHTRFLMIFLALLTGSAAFTQRLTIDDFTMSGDTYKTEDFCYRLTDEEDYSSGSIWYRQPVSLAEPFGIELSVLLGCQDESGADGMVFMFASQPNRTGYRGEGIGFAGLAPSLGIEIDTWRNYHLNDPAEDHIAFLINGQVGHFSESAKPVIIPNLEDCKRHKLAVRWDPSSKIVSVEIDGKEITSMQVDLINGIFNGKTELYWGVSAATGRYNNFHEVCFDRLTFRSPRHLPSLHMRDNRKLWADKGLTFDSGK